MNSQELSTEVIVEEQDYMIEDPNLEKGPFFNKDMKIKLIKAGILIVVALISIFVFGTIFSDPATYTGMNETLDEKKVNVMALAATTTGASAAISLLPNNAGAPIADKLVDFSSYFMVILAVIYLEKFLLTTLALLSFDALVPAAMILFIVALFANKESRLRSNMMKLGAKVVAFGIAIVLVVPVSVAITDNIDSSFNANLQAANEAAQQATDELNQSIDNAQDNAEEEGNWFDGIVSTVQNGISAITEGIQNALDNLASNLNNLIDTLAVMVVTSCLIPLIVLFLFLQLAKMIAGLDFGGPGSIMQAASRTGRTAFSSVKKTIAKTN